MEIYSLNEYQKHCVVVGTTRLCLSVLEKLHVNHWKILSVVSEDLAIQQFCLEKKIPWTSDLEQIEESHFVLFSVANYQIIRDAFLKSRNVSVAINYHDSLLPKYAGVNSTTWAIYQNEAKHGVSWHFISSGIDEGAIVKQASVEIAPTETAFSLNLKIFEIAVRTFDSLLNDFENHALEIIDQDISQKTYFGREYIPENYGIVNFQDPYEKIDRLVRSLNFGEYPNPIGTIKIWDGKKVFLPTSISFTAREKVEAGKVYFATESFFEIGIQDGILLIQGLISPEGNKVSLKETNFQTGAKIFSYLLNEEEKKILSSMKKKEAKALKTILSENSSFFPKALSNIGLEKIERKISFDPAKREEILSKLSLVLLKFIHQDCCIKIRHSFPINSPWIKELVNLESYFQLTPSQQNTSFEEFANQLKKKETYWISKDFIYRYMIDAKRHDVLITDGVPASDPARLTFSISDEEIVMIGLIQDEILVHSLHSSIIYILNEKIDPHALIHTLSPLSFEDRDRILVEWNRTEKPFPKNKTIHELFEEQVLETPDEIAIIFNEDALTFKELNQKSNQLARWIRSEYQRISKKPISPNTPLPICLDRSLDMVVAMMAVLKAGGAYVPIEPNYPFERIKYILKDINAELMIGMKEGLSVYRIQISDSLYQSRENLGAFCQPTDLAYLIYTSGTTGNPKGVMIEHTSAINTLWDLENVYDFQSQHKKTACYCSYVFDVSVTEIFSSLLRGGELHLFDNTHKYSPELLSKYIEEKKLNYVYLPPAILGLLPKKNYPSLRAIIFAGEPCDQSVGAYWASKLKLYNYYGPTECAIYATGKLAQARNINEIGRPISNKKAYIFDTFLNAVPIGVIGELYIGGFGQALGYLNLSELTREKFLKKGEERLYKTGDLVRWMPDGSIEYIGRNDFQVKIRGFRIELGEIEKILSQHPKINQSTVLVKEEEGQKSLMGFYIAKESLDPQEIVIYLKSKLPDYMVPTTLIQLEEFPTTFTGKLDRAKLLSLKPKISAKTAMPPVSELEKTLLVLWSEVLKTDQISMDDGFFQLGGNSLLAMILMRKLNDLFSSNLSILTLFQYPTISSLSAHLLGQKKEKKTTVSSGSFNEVAIIGMACRVPGANSVKEFWKNLENGIESIQDMPEKPGLIAKAANIDEYLAFDAPFFGYTAREAQSMDPQHRHFMELVVEALDDAGCTQGEQVGLYAGQGESVYYLHQIFKDEALEKDLGDYQVRINNEKDFLTTKISYKLNLTGPSLNIQTACSSSLVAVHVAIGQLMAEECEVAVAGGISLEQREGYQYKKGMIESSDGRCRPFDQEANGTVISSGGGVIVLKPLAKALEDKNQIYAVIKGTAINNDGGMNHKIGYTAPSSQGQAEAIRRALKRSQIDPSTISYVEAHGTGTKIGDPIELFALHEVFSEFQKKENSIAIGSVKSNIGHTDAAAGIIGLIKTALALIHGKIPPSLHFKAWNPEIQRFNKLFHVPQTLTSWTSEPRRAGISSFGIGGTNAHAILEEAPRREKAKSTKPAQICLLSAETESSLNRYFGKLQSYLTDESLLDLAYTLQIGRKHRKHRSFFIAEDLKEPFSLAAIRSYQAATPVLMFSGQGSQYINMAADLYRAEPVFADTVDQCCKLLKEDIFSTIFANPLDNNASEKLKQTQYAQPSLFIIAYAMSQLLLSLGLKPKALIGHSVGEYVAAAVSKIFSWEDALQLVALRGKLMQSAKPGAMLSIQISVEKVMEILPITLDLSVVNGPNLCVVSGEIPEIRAFSTFLASQQIEHTLLHTSHAFHSRMMEPILEEFEKALSSVKRNEPQIPILSNTTGDWLSSDQAKAASYWRDHIRKPVLFYQGIRKIKEKWNTPLFIETGPGRTLSALVKQIDDHSVHTIRHPKQKESDYGVFLQALGEIWQFGIDLDWKQFHRNEGGHLISLPPYAFDHQEYSLIPQEKKDETSITQMKDPLEEIWKGVLGVKTIRAFDHFFELGGHSLLAAQLVRRIQETFQIGLEIREVFQNPTFEEMRLLIQKKTSQSLLSSQQKALWILQEIHGNKFNAYNESLLFEIKGAISIPILEQAIKSLMERHEILRVRIAVGEDGAPYQASEIIEADIKEEGEILEEIEKTFALSKGPLFRVRVIKNHLLFVFHHTIIDGASLRIFTQELSEVYNALIDKRIPNLTPSKSYREYVEHQRKFFETEEYRKKIEFWKKNLAGCQEINLTQNRPRKHVFSYEGDKHFFRIERELALKIKAFAKQEKSTLFNLFLAALSLLLSRYSRQDDVLVGAPMLNRPGTEYLNTLGFFTNTVVLRNLINQAHCFREHLREVSLNTLSAYEHQDIPFDHLVSHLNIERDASRNPLVQVLLLVVNQNSHPKLQFKGISTQIIHRTAHPIAKMDLSLGVFEQEEMLEGYYEYSTDIFQKETVIQFAKNLEDLLAKVIEEPEKPLKNLSIIDNKDRQMLVTDWNPLYTPRTIQGTLHERFSETAKKFPKRTALKWGEQTLTYEELDAKSNQLAHLIVSKKGILPRDSLIAICIEPSLDMIISMLAVLKAGAAYVPIDPKYPIARIEHIISDSAAKIVLIQEKLKEVIPVLFSLEPNRTLLIEEALQEIEKMPSSPLERTYSEKDLAYVIYTSGSTGKPKGVLIPHSNVLDLMYSGQKHYNFTENDVWVLFHSFAFDVSVWEIWGTFLYGGKLVIVSYETTRDPHAFYEITKQEKITVLNQTPSAFRNYIEADVATQKKIETLRIVIFAGESLDIEMLRDWWLSHPDSHPLLVNMYGITETTVHASYQPLSFSDLIEARHGRIGSPLNHLMMYVLDEQRNLCPIGVPGELYVGRGGVARGYLNRDELTRERFFSNPFVEGCRLYKSGDLVRWMPDGTLEYIGRTDFQVKLRGFRIELGEIESVLMKYQGVKQAVVLLREDAEQKYLACYFTGKELDLFELRAHLTLFLPEYMVPNAFVHLTTIPLTVNGKIDRGRLPKPDMSAMGGHYTSPANRLEEEIAKIWSELLQIDLSKISTTANYFQLGGNSLSIVKMISRVKAFANTDLPLSAFWKSPTICRIARLIEGKEETAPLEKMKMLILQDLDLPKKIFPLSMPNAALFKPKKILLTGASGFLGAYLLKELSKLEGAEIWCLVRGQNKLGLKNVLFGDLEKEQLGLSDKEFQALAETIDVIYHNGAFVHHLYDYERLRAANVGSTKTLLNLAAIGKNKALHYISTIGVKNFDVKSKLKQKSWSFHEMNGYLLTKWVSEQLVVEAASRGILARIYRPGNITGSTETGYCRPEFNYTLLKIKGFIQIGCGFYQEEEPFEMVPVDILAQDIVAKSLKIQEKVIYNLDNPVKIPFSSYVEQYVKAQYPIKKLQSLLEWQQKLSTVDELNALYSTRAFYDHPEESRTVAESSDLEISLNYDEMIQKQIEFLEKAEFIQRSTTPP